MTLTIPESFNYPTGRLANWTTPANPLIDSTAVVKAMLQNDHVEVRNFTNAAITRPRTQTDLDDIAQSVLDTQTQDQLDFITLFAGENWTTSSATGITGSARYGKIAGWNGLTGMAATCNGANLNFIIASSIPLATQTGLDLSEMDYISLVLPTIAVSGFATTSFIQLSSDSDGGFVTATNAITFASSVGTTAYEVRIPLSLYTNVNLASVTGVKLKFVTSSPPANGTIITAMALRGITKRWTPRAFDVSTQTFNYKPSKPLDNIAAADDLSEQIVPLVRGNGLVLPAHQAQTVTGAASSLTVTKPANLANGSLLLAQVNWRGNAVITPPAGWTLIHRDNDTQITIASYYRFVDGTEDATFSWSGDNSTGASVAVHTLLGVDPVNPVNISSSANSATITGTAATAPAITPTIINTTLVQLTAIARNAAITQAATMAEEYDFQYTGGNPIGAEFGYELFEPVTSTGTRVSTWTGAAQWVTQLIAFNPISGNNDPRPIDASIQIRFNTGSLAFHSPQYNTIDLICREDHSDNLNGRYLTARISYTGDATQATVFRTSIVAGGATFNAPFNAPQNFVGPVLLPLQNYACFFEVVGIAYTISVFKTDENGVLGEQVWSTGQVVDTTLVKEAGRVGFYPKFIDLDGSVDDFSISSTAYSTIRTKVFASHTPVVGAQLQAAYSTDQNLFTNYEGSFILDATKTYNQIATYRFADRINTNQFLLEDWANTYVQFAIWVPPSSTAAIQPAVVLRSQSTTSEFKPALPPLQPGQWNALRLPLRPFDGSPAGINYKVYVERPSIYATSDSPGPWWVSPMTVGRRTITWQMRSRSDPGTWRNFEDMVNDPSGALHLPRQEQGTELQLQAIALTPDAWISNFTIFPRYAELGKPRYYTP